VKFLSHTTVIKAERNLADNSERTGEHMEAVDKIILTNAPLLGKIPEINNINSILGKHAPG